MTTSDREIGTSDRTTAYPPRSQKFRLRTTLVVPFVLQIVAAVGCVGYLSFKSGQQAIEDLASQLRGETASRVRDRVDRYLNVPHLVNQINARTFAQNLLDLNDTRQLETYFWQQSQLFQEIGTIAFANERGDFIGANGAEKYIAVAIPDSSGNRSVRRYAVDGEGQPGTLLREKLDYDATSRAWYKKAVATGQPIWTEVEPSSSSQRLDISATYPLYNEDRTLRGVLLSEFDLTLIGKFLQGLKVGKTGQVFIIERTGFVIANSTGERPFLAGATPADEPKRLLAKDSENPVIRTATQALIERAGNLSQINQPQQLNYAIDGKQHFLQVVPFQDGIGIDWLIVVDIPESDFMAQIHQNARTTVGLCALALVVAIAFGILTARWISRPILELMRGSEEIARGNFDRRILIEDVVQTMEIEKLTRSFNLMAEQLKTSFNALEARKNAFARFFPSDFLNFLNKNDVTELELGDRVSKEMAIVFSDIRSFTNLSESMTPEENFNFVNSYLQCVCPEIRAGNGLVVKFIGDAVMAVFPNSVDDAVQAGIAQFQQLRLFNQVQQKQGLLPVEIGMGIDIGYMMVGLVGELNRVQIDVISDRINLTARLEGLTKFYGAAMVISEDVVKRLKNPDRYHLRFLDRAIVKGRTEAIGIYEVLAAESASVRELKLQTLSDFQMGLERYARGDLEKARWSFDRVLAVNSSDKTTRLYLERIEGLQAKGIPEHWNGTWTFTQK